MQGAQLNSSLVHLTVETYDAGRVAGSLVLETNISSVKIKNLIQRKNQSCSVLRNL